MRQKKFLAIHLIGCLLALAMIIGACNNGSSGTAQGTAAPAPPPTDTNPPGGGPRPGTALDSAGDTSKSKVMLLKSATSASDTNKTGGNPKLKTVKQYVDTSGTGGTPKK